MSDNKKNLVELNAREANEWQLRHAHNPDYRSDALDDATGAETRSYLTKDKKGRDVFIQERTYGGFTWFGDFLIVLLISLALFGTIRDIVLFIIDRDIVNLVIFAILTVILIPVERYEVMSLIDNIKKKRDYKRGVKEGKIKKKKLTTGMILYRMTLFAFLGFMAFGLINLFLQEVLHFSMTKEVTESLVIGFAAVYVICWASYAISIPVTLIMNKYKRDKQ